MTPTGRGENGAGSGSVISGPVRQNSANSDSCTEMRINRSAVNARSSMARQLGGAAAFSGVRLVVRWLEGGASER